MWPLSKTKDTQIVVMTSQTALCDEDEERGCRFWSTSTL